MALCKKVHALRRRRRHFLRCAIRLTLDNINIKIDPKLNRGKNYFNKFSTLCQQQAKRVPAGHGRSYGSWPWQKRCLMVMADPSDLGQGKKANEVKRIYASTSMLTTFIDKKNLERLYIQVVVRLVACLVCWSVATLGWHYTALWMWTTAHSE